MSQTDLNVANASGSVVRADINNHLSALATLSSGASAPSTTFANMWWMDTTNNILKQRNAANSAWINVASKVSNTWIPYNNGVLLGSAANESAAAFGTIAGLISISTRFDLSGVISPTSLGSSQNNWSPTGLSTASTIRVTASTPINITGLVGGASGRIIVIHNIGANAITLVNDSTSTAANRFLFGSDLVVGADKSVALQYDDTTDRWRLISSSSSNAQSYAKLSDEKPTGGFPGGTFTAGSYVKRTLNTEVDADGIVTLASSVFTLEAGTYYISASAPAFAVNSHKAKIRNTTDGTDALIGTVQHAGSEDTTRSLVNGQITIASQKSFELQHRCETTRNTDGLGPHSSFGDVEVYSVVEIWRIA